MEATRDDLTPKQIVEELDRYIIGQKKAKRAVAVALRNRWRRQRLPEDIRDEVLPKNIIMIGPTGVGKTEIARRLSRLTGAPFIKVEATKYTEVGYVGRDVESMVRDLVSNAVKIVRSEMEEGVREEAKERVIERILDRLLPGVRPKPHQPDTPSGVINISIPPKQEDPAAGAEDKGEKPQSSTRDKFRKKIQNGEMDDRKIEIEVSPSGTPMVEILSGTNMEDMGMALGNISNMFGNKKKKKKVTIAQAKEILLAEEMDRLIDHDRVAEIARERVQQTGIIFIDEIDKIAVREKGPGGDVSREGVQRDILPIVEGSTVNTRYGMIDTSHILFIAAGAFHMSKPSDLIPELQGRFPIRVELEDLDADDFVLILTQPRNALTRQYRELLNTEGVEIEFTEEGIRALAEIAMQVNSSTENIGARRLHTILEHILEDLSFEAPDINGQKIPITEDYVRSRLQDISQDRDLSRYIL